MALLNDSIKVRAIDKLFLSAILASPPAVQDTVPQGRHIADLMRPNDALLCMICAFDVGNPGLTVRRDGGLVCKDDFEQIVRLLR